MTEDKITISDISHWPKENLEHSDGKLLSALDIELISVPNTGVGFFNELFNDRQKQIAAALGIPSSALVKKEGATSEIVEFNNVAKYTREELADQVRSGTLSEKQANEMLYETVIESDESWEASAALLAPQTLTQVVDDVLASHEKGEWLPQSANHQLIDGKDYSVSVGYEQDKDGAYNKVSETKMHGHLTCTGKECKICNAINVLKNRKPIMKTRSVGLSAQFASTEQHLESRKIDQLMKEYEAQLGRDPTEQDKKEFYRVLDIVNSRAKEEVLMGDHGMDSGTAAYSPRPTKSQIGQALANQKRAMKFANRLKRKEKAQRNKCKGY